jgi:uncharacterized oligopeptide transporter (OPT) family protein
MMAAEAHMQERQLTARGLLIGLGGLIVITASSMYVALRMGALPWPTVFVTVISMAALKKCKNSTIHEINCTHTVMSAGAMVAGGLAFTLPGLWMLDPSASIPTFTLIALTIVGTILGTAFTAVFRRRMIEQEQLPYPMGQAAYNTLSAGMEGGKNAKTLFASMGASALFTAIRDGAGKIPSLLQLAAGTAFSQPMYIWVSPMAVGIGAIIGPVLALVWLLGMVLGYYVITPVGLATGLFADMNAAELFRQNLGIGLMIGTGLGVLVKAVIHLISKRTKTERKKLTPRALFSLLLLSLLCMIMLTLTTSVTFPETIVLVIGVFCATYLSSMLTGQTGINPMEIFGILVLLVVQPLFHPALAPAFTIVAVTAVACGLAGDVMNDLKCGYLLGADPRQQILGEGIGGVVGSIVSVFVLLALKQSFGSFGTAELPAPQAAAVSAMIGGPKQIPAFLIGCVVGLVLFLCNVPTATLGLGVYLSTAISTIMAVGALVALLVRKVAGRAKTDTKLVDTNLALVSSGFLGGEGITGVIIAIISMF